MEKVSNDLLLVPRILVFSCVVSVYLSNNQNHIVIHIQNVFDAWSVVSLPVEVTHLRTDFYVVLYVHMSVAVSDVTQTALVAT